MNFCYFLIGPPLAGKNTFLDKYLFDEASDPHIISLDDIIEHVAKVLSSTYSEVFQDVVKHAERALNKKIPTLFKYGTNVIWNMTNLTINSRRKKLSQVPESYKKIAVLIQWPSLEALQERNEKRFKDTGKNIPVSVIKSMIESYNPPSFSEGFSEIWTVNSKPDGSYLIDKDYLNGSSEVINV